ncbi:uncharacterized protein Z520_08064 [Fonsecaea multimorphosa CBS 102226]|uniref:Gfo/Idh/MocA-like oxidoreductase N-terminal domain-containing protein n=1 Tax=Fonsecaea multimorphosa CBS 102226 TaxID=1442371 RepID=A0A0D2IGV4_9EURO|nr:uncharacterized protein Z520_08064 [Fonsecaea multimorphosa CBS 102226]KIX96286.1 hypothetical protein Z520_08064 [Fonsecaea multimorphosa CBS 102226]OAL21948.1 hypothetical protein AYO22_07545 [Fonsecaea multimorphosa]
MAPIRLGVIGLSSEGSWAAGSHLPYLLGSSHYQITALQNSSRASAEKAVQKYNLPGDVACYGDVESLVRDPNVDLIVVSVKTPTHYGLARPAIEAKKDVFVEWPLGANVREAEELTSLAKSHNVKTMIGLQARQNPSIRKAKEMVAAGQLGEILGTTMVGSGVIMGRATPAPLEYELSIESGANLVTIPAMHAIDALCFVLGEFQDLQATLANHRPKMPIIDPATGKVQRLADKTCHDHMSLTGTLIRGAVASVVYQGGHSLTSKDFYWEINGIKGSLILEAPSGLVEMFHPSLKFVRAEEQESFKFFDDGKGPQPEEVKVEVASDFSYNVGQAWDAFAGAGSGTVTTFEDALVRHKMIEAIYRSSEKGTRETYI